METRLLCSIFIRWLLCTFLEIFFLIFPFQVGFQSFFLRLRNNSEWVYLHKFTWAECSWSIQPQGPFRPWERRKSFSTVYTTHEKFYHHHRHHHGQLLLYKTLFAQRLSCRHSIREPWTRGTIEKGSNLPFFLLETLVLSFFSLGWHCYTAGGVGGT